MDRSVLARKPMTELKDIASHLNMRGYQKLRKAELIDAIMDSGTGRGQQALDTSEEDGARKVLPPTERDATGSADVPTSGDASTDADTNPPATAARSQDDATTRDAEDSGGGEGREPRARSRGGRGAEARQPSETEEQQGEGDAEGRDGAPADDEDADGSKRRSRRDRRKRNRDRAGEDQSPQPSSTPSGSTSGGGGGQASDPGEVRAGVLDILPEGYGFLRTTGYLPGERDVYVSQGQIRKHGLRRGDVVQGPIRQQRSNEKVPALHHVQKVNGEGLEDGQVPSRPAFDELPITADPVRVALAGVDGATDAVRLVDLVAPIGLGHRALVLSPPRAAKERLLRELADALVDAAPDAHLMMVLLDERPEVVALAVEEVDGEVIASTFEQAAEEHAQIAELAFERARRMVELGHDVVLLVDSMTRLARALGVTVQTSGRAIAPGVEAAALYPVKRMLSAARRIDGGGSLTVIAVALTDTGSALDEVILQELRRTATTEVVLDDALTRRRVWPSVSVLDSDTRDEAGLQTDEERATVAKLRRALESMPPADATALVLDKLAQTDTNDDFLSQILRAELGASESTVRSSS